MVSWRKSPLCGNTNCVEVARQGDLYAVRDSKDPDGPVLRFTASEWDAFKAGIRADGFEF
jgi:hypothetical protein